MSQGGQFVENDVPPIGRECGVDRGSAERIPIGSEYQVQCAGTGRNGLVHGDIAVHDGIGGSGIPRVKRQGRCPCATDFRDRGIDRDIPVRRLDRDIRIAVQGCGYRVSIYGGRCRSARTGCHGHVGRIKQPQAPLAAFSTGIDFSERGHAQILATRRLDLAALPRPRAARGDLAGHPGRLSRPQHGGAAIAVFGGVGANHAALLLHHGLRFANGGVLALPAAADQHLAAAGRTGGVEFAAGRQRHAAAGGDDLAAPVAGLAADGQHLAADPGFAGTAVEPDLAVLRGQGVGAHHAGLVDGHAQRLGGAVGGEDDAAAVGADQALVFDLGGGRGIDGDADQAAGAEFQARVLAGGQGHLAGRGADAAAVLDRAAHQGDETAFAGGEFAVVDDAGIAAGEPVVAGEEVRVGQVHGRGHQAADVHPGRGPEHDAAGGQQEHLAIGAEVAVDLGGVGGQHAVEHDGTGGGLHEADGGLAADVEGLPVGDHPGRVLLHGHAGGRLGDGPRAGDDLGAGGQGRGRGWRGVAVGQGQDEHRGAQGAARRTGLAQGARGFVRDDPGVAAGTPNDLECLVHLSTSCGA